MKQTISLRRVETLTFQTDTLEPLGQLTIETMARARQKSLGGLQSLSPTAHAVSDWKLVSTKVDEDVEPATLAVRRPEPAAKRRRR